MAGKTPNSKQVSSGPLEDIKQTALHWRFAAARHALETSQGSCYRFPGARGKRPRTSDEAVLFSHCPAPTWFRS